MRAAARRWTARRSPSPQRRPRGAKRPVPLRAQSELAHILEKEFADAAHFMSGVAGPGGFFLERADRTNFGAMITSLRHLELPHAARCLDLCIA